MKKVCVLASALLGTIFISACSNSTAESDVLNEVVSSTYVSPEGQILDKLIYKFDTLNPKTNLSTDDFNIDITNTIVDYATGEETVTTDSANVAKVSVGDNEVVIDIEDIPYKTITDMTVTSENKEFSSKLEDYKLETKTADQFNHSEFTDSNGTEISYWLYTPESEESSPLVIWEHGGGEVLSTSFEGSNLVSSQGATTWIENGFETSVLSIQYPENYQFGISEIPEELSKMEAFNMAKYELVQSLIEDGTVDSSKVYLTGASSGGGGALRFIMQYPDLFAGALITSAKDTVVPISLKYDLAYQLEDQSKLKITEDQYAETYNKMAEELKNYPEIINVPIWFVQAENDQVTTSYTSIMMDDILKEMGAEDNKITLYSNEEMEAGGVHDVYHASWQLAYQDKEMLNWLFEQQK